MLNKNATRSLALLTATTAVTLVSTGCRSMPGASMFGLRRGPSAEALAGSGPSTTYPKPPSHTATPEAITSIASNTADNESNPIATASATIPSDEEGIPGFDISPGYALPGAADPDALASNDPENASAGAPPLTSPSAPNLAAAQANGMYGPDGNPYAGTTQAATYKSQPNSSTPSQPSGYTFGTKALMPKPTSQSPAAPETAVPERVASAASPEPSSTGGTASNPFVLPSQTDGSTPTATASGFSFPSDAPATAAITPPSTDEDQLAGKESTESPLAEVTASLESGFGTPEFSAASTTGLAPVLPSSKTPEGYAPGSTAGATSYPGKKNELQTRGSFYR